MNFLEDHSFEKILKFAVTSARNRMYQQIEKIALIITMIWWLMEPTSVTYWKIGWINGDIEKKSKLSC
jgi:hypothetical protein